MSNEKCKNNLIEEYEVSPSSVVELVKNGKSPVILDVRDKEEYEKSHLENSILLSVHKLSQKSLTDIGLGEKSKDNEIIIYCRSGVRSKTAYEIIKSLGYTNIKSMAGGIVLWEESGYQFTETDSKVRERDIDKGSIL